MPRFSSKRRVAHRADEMFDLVADVERYPEFVPLCKALKVRQRRQNPDGTETVVADMTVSFKLVREAFTSEVTLDRAGRGINVRYLRGPFSNLENRWTFEPKGEDKGEQACDVGFFIAYEFKSRMLAMLMGTMFDAAFAKFSAAFAKRADVVYGKRPVGSVS
jgi:coenzyme Q-binding protein COQ10